MPWKKARKLIRDDPRYKNFTESDHVRLQLASRKPTQYTVGEPASACLRIIDIYIYTCKMVSHCSQKCVFFCIGSLVVSVCVIFQRREAEYDKHLRDKMVMAKNEFRSLLRETKIISYK